ncbi:MAG TPA: DUF4388 domain-containing protein [Chthoniobacteraceae bacterium]
MNSSAVHISKGFDGVIQGATLSDLIQMECLALTTRAVRVDRGGASGRIFFAGGQIVHAELGALEGEGALYQMLAWPNGAFSIEEGVRPLEQTIERHWHSLLLEAAHQADELAAISADTPATVIPLHSIPTPTETMAKILEDPEIVSAVCFTEDGSLLQSRGEDPETLQSTFAYIIQLSRLIGASLGAENLQEINFLAPDRKALCVITSDTATGVITSSKANLAQLAKSLA